MMSRRVHQLLIDDGRPLSLAQIRAIALPDRDPGTVQSVITGLVKARKIRCAGQRAGRNVYTFVRGATVTRRNEKATPAASEPNAQALPTQQQKAEHVAAPLVNPQGGAHARDKADQSAQITADIAAFEARGGRIQKLRNGEISRPLKHIGVDAEYLEARAKGRANQSQRRKTA